MLHLHKEININQSKYSQDLKSALKDFIFILFYFIFFVFLRFSGAAPAAYGGSQAGGPIRAVAAGLHQSHSNLGSETHLQPTPQLTAMLDP